MGSAHSHGLKSRGAGQGWVGACEASQPWEAAKGRGFAGQMWSLGRVGRGMGAEYSCSGSCSGSGLVV